MPELIVVRVQSLKYGHREWNQDLLPNELEHKEFEELRKYLHRNDLRQELIHEFDVKNHQIERLELRGGRKC